MILAVSHLEVYVTEHPFFLQYACMQTESEYLRNNSFYI